MISCSLYLFRPYPSYPLLSLSHSSCSHQPPSQIFRSGRARGGCEQLDHSQEGQPPQHNGTPAQWNRDWRLRRTMRSNKDCCCCILERYKQERRECKKKSTRRRRRENEKLNYGSRTTSSQQQHPEKDESETEGLVSLKACPLIKVMILLFHLSTYCDMIWYDVMWCDVMWCD